MKHIDVTHIDVAQIDVKHIDVTHIDVKHIDTKTIDTQCVVNIGGNLYVLKNSILSGQVHIKSKNRSEERR